MNGNNTLCVTDSAPYDVRCPKIYGLFYLIDRARGTHPDTCRPAKVEFTKPDNVLCPIALKISRTRTSNPSSLTC